MMQFPELKTERLILRAFQMSDARDVQRLAGDRDIASTTSNIPHPYEDGMAEEWIGTHQTEFQEGKGVTFAVVLADSGTVIGSIGFHNISYAHERAELGYWIGKPYWNKGYATEAAKAALRYGFEELGLNRIEAYHFTRNPASGKVMQKISMTREGHIREYVKKWDRFEDSDLYGILRSDFLKTPGT